MDKITKANKAKALLEDEIFQIAMQEVESAIIDTWRACAYSDEETQFKCKLSLVLLANLEQNLHNYVEDGELEEFQIAQENEPEFLGELRAWKPTTKQ